MMPSELVRIASGLRWFQTLIRPGELGLETEICFEVEGIHWSLAFNSIPDRAFLAQLAYTSFIAVFEFSFEERGWVEPGRYQIWIEDEAVSAEYVRWGPIDLI